MNVQEKIIFLSALKERKEKIFGKFSNEISRESKVGVWNEIVNVLRAHDVTLSRDKPFTYFRDTVWPNLRRYTIEKRDKRRRTGENGGKQMKWTEIDCLVLDIIGEDSPAVVGLSEGLETSWDVINESMTESENINPNIPNTSTQSSIKRKRKPNLDEFTTEFRAKKLKKLDLEIENLELRNALLRRHLNNGKPSSPSLVMTDAGFVYQNL